MPSSTVDRALRPFEVPLARSASELPSSHWNRKLRLGRNWVIRGYRCSYRPDATPFEACKSLGRPWRNSIKLVSVHVSCRRPAQISTSSTKSYTSSGYASFTALSIRKWSLSGATMGASEPHGLGPAAPARITIHGRLRPCPHGDPFTWCLSASCGPSAPSGRTACHW